MKPRLVGRIAIATLAMLASAAANASSGWLRIVPSGQALAETRAASGYKGVSLSLPGTVIVRQGEPASVLVEADDNLMPEIETVVQNGLLKIRFRRQLNLSGRATIRVLVTGPAFDSLSIAGSGDILAESIKGATLSLSIGGSGDVKIARLAVDALAVSIAGSGGVRAAGRADELAVKIAGAGDLTAGALEAKRATVSIAGSGDAVLQVRESLDAHIAGSGDVLYRGDPVVTRKIAGAGSVKRLGPAS